MPQFTLLGGGYHAEISPRGGALRVLRHGERELVASWPEEGPIPYYSGTILAPWPNRVVGARYGFADTVYELPVNEPDRGHALHGLVSDVSWTCREYLAAEDQHGLVRLAHLVEPSPGYPFRLALEARYEVSGSGVTTTLSAENIGEYAAPYGCGPHPWLLAGDQVEAYELEVPASRVLLVDASLAPRELADVTSTPYDFRRARPIGGTVVDHAFTELAEGRVRITGPEGGLEITWDVEVMPWVQVCTGTGLGHRGLAVEPMTCPPDAFNSGTDLVVLKPGDTHQATWTLART